MKRFWWSYILQTTLCGLIVLCVGCTAIADNTSSVPNYGGEQSGKQSLSDDYQIKLAEQFELFAGGGNFEDYHNPATSFVMGLLATNSLNGTYTDSDGLFTMEPVEQLQIGNLFFDSDAIANGDFVHHMFGAEYNAVTLHPFEIDVQTDKTTVLFGRFYIAPNGEDAWLFPVKYTFVPCTIKNEDIPALLRSKLNSAEMVYKIQDVENIRDVATAIEIYSKNGYSAMFKMNDYLLKTADDVVQMAKRINSGSFGEVYSNYSLENDIDLADVDFYPIGQRRRAGKFSMDPRNPDYIGYNGMFSGNGHTISNMHIEDKDGVGLDAIGFFGVLGKEANVNGLSLTSAVVECENASNVGIFAGFIFSGAEIRECSVSGRIHGSVGVGGFVGNVSHMDKAHITNITNCFADAEVKGTTTIGGFAGYIASANVTGCAASGMVTAQSYSETVAEIGGFAGNIMSTKIINSRCAVGISVLNDARAVGSFVGLNFGQIENCAYLSTLSNWEPTAKSQGDEYTADIKAISKAEYDRASG